MFEELRNMGGQGKVRRRKNPQFLHVWWSIVLSCNTQKKLVYMKHLSYCFISSDTLCVCVCVCVCMNACVCMYMCVQVYVCGWDGEGVGVVSVYVCEFVGVGMGWEWTWVCMLACVYMIVGGGGVEVVNVVFVCVCGGEGGCQGWWGASFHFLASISCSGLPWKRKLRSPMVRTQNHQAYIAVLSIGQNIALLLEILPLIVTSVNSSSFIPRPLHA